MLDPDTWLLPGSGLAARLAAGAAVEAVSFVMAAPDRRALCLVRPPGHHARPASGMGFCIYGNVAVAAEDALARFDLNRVLIVDFDVHHGNGTQEVFYESSRVGFLSIHRYPFYPGTGAKDETGTGEGLGSTRNIPLAYGTPRSRVSRGVSAGTGDAGRPDPTGAGADQRGIRCPRRRPGRRPRPGGRGLRDPDQGDRRVAETHAGGRIVSVLEGGYNVPILAGCVEIHLHALGAEPGRI